MPASPHRIPQAKDALRGADRKQQNSIGSYGSSRAIGMTQKFAVVDNVVECLGGEVHTDGRRTSSLWSRGLEKMHISVERLYLFRYLGINSQVKLERESYNRSQFRGRTPRGKR